MPHKLFTDDGSSLMDAEDTSGKCQEIFQRKAGINILYAAAANLRSTFDTGVGFFVVKLFLIS